MGRVCSWSLGHELTQPVNPNPNSNRNAKRNAPPVQVLAAPAPRSAAGQGSTWQDHPWLPAGVAGWQEGPQGGRLPRCTNHKPRAPRSTPALVLPEPQAIRSPPRAQARWGLSAGFSRRVPGGADPKAWHSPAGWAPSADTVQ